MAGTCEYGNKLSGSIKCEEFLDQLQNQLASEKGLCSMEFLCTVDCRQSNLVFCHNDTLVCSPYMVLIISSFSGIVNVMCLVMPAVACLLILGS